MLAVQSSIAEKIPGFKFNLGYSGRGYKRGNNEEDDGDEAILEYAHRFTWFGHLFGHEQAHRLNLDDLIKSLKTNKKFAEVVMIVMLFKFQGFSVCTPIYTVSEILVVPEME